MEKASDVNLALDLISDTQKNIFDEAYLISNDGDFSGAVKAVKNLGKTIIYVAIGNRKMVNKLVHYHCKPTSNGVLFLR